MIKKVYTDPTTATNPPGGKHHDLRKEAGAPLLTDHDALDDPPKKQKRIPAKKSDASKATSPRKKAAVPAKKATAAKKKPAATKKKKTSASKR